MSTGARLTVTDLRRTTRHPVDQSLVATHRTHGDIPVHIANISAQGFMIDSVEEEGQVERGDRLVVTLPMVGRIEAHCMWTRDTRAGFQFERIIPADELTDLVRRLQRRPRARGRSSL